MMERKCRHLQGHHQRSPESQDRVWVFLRG